MCSKIPAEMEAAAVNIWTERLQENHIPILENWAGRNSGALTKSDFPTDKVQLLNWYHVCAANPKRQDYIVLAYDTPVGITGLLKPDADVPELQFYLRLGETNYNLIRTATYATLQMLDRAFQDFDCKYVVTQINAVNTLFSDVLEQMGFYLKAEQNGRFAVAIEKDMFLKRKYLF